MNAPFVRIVFLGALLFSSSLLRAQSVESVLRALQERVMMLDVRTKYAGDYGDTFIYVAGNTIKATPVQWPGGLPAFPQEETITSLPQAIDALNAASRVFDEIKGEFLAYDPANHQFANLLHASSNGDEESDGAIGDPGWSGTDGESPNETGWVVGSKAHDPTTFVMPRLKLRSIGQFTESNWREKLQLLASSINQLKALEWRVICRMPEAKTFGYGDYTSMGISRNADRQSNVITWKVDFPRFTADNYTLPNALIAVGPDIGLVGRIDGSGSNALDWTIDGYALDCTEEETEANFVRQFYGDFFLKTAVGARVYTRNLSEVSNEAYTPSVAGTFDFFVGGAVFPYGDLTEGVAPQLTSNATKPFRIGSLYKVPTPPIPVLNGVMLGAFGQDVEPPPREPEEYYVYALSTDSAANAAFTWMGLTRPTVKASLVAAPANLNDYFAEQNTFTDGSFFTAYEFEFENVPSGPEGKKVIATARRASDVGLLEDGTRVFYNRAHHFRLLVRSVFILNSADLPTTPIAAALFEHPPGEVETTLTNRELVRVHVGRGVNDQNQTAWLGTRSDGFGWMRFHGSPRAFELLYQTDPDLYGHEPYGGKTFDTVMDFTATEKVNSGWKDRFSYYAKWTSPQLRQVKGRDVLVDITYPNPYTKNLNFYWISQVNATKGADGFYTLLGGESPFKTVKISNPTLTTGGAKLPAERDHLRVVELRGESGERYHEITHVLELQPEKQDVYHFKLGAEEQGADFEKIVKVRDYPGAQGAIGNSLWITEEKAGGVLLATTTTDYYLPGLSIFKMPLPYSERAEVKKITRDDGEGEKEITFDWDELEEEFPDDYYGLYRSLKKITWSGPPSWPENGRVIEFHQSGRQDCGMVKYEAERIGEKLHEVSHPWNGNTRTTTRKLGGLDYTSETAAYSANLREVTMTVGGKPAGKLVYNSSGTEVETISPGGYREKSTISVTGTEVSTTVKSGWDAAYNIWPTIQQATYARNGSLIHGTTSVNGLTMETITGSDFTRFGAPRLLTALDGSETPVFYSESGVRWGTPVEMHLPNGIQPTFSADVFGRPDGWSDGFESFTVSYPEAKKIQVSSVSSNSADPAKSMEVEVNGSGELKSLTQTTGTWETLNLVPGLTSSMQRFGRTKEFSVDATGVLNSVENGMGSRGAKFTIGVQNGELYTEVTPKQKGGGDANYVIKTVYDKQGRVKLVSGPGGDGVLAQETWSYDDTNRSVTYTPRAGPSAQTITRTLSSDGKTLTIKKGGNNYLSYTTSVGIGELVRTTSLYNDSGGGGGTWQEVAKETYNPLTKATSQTPWGLSGNKISMTRTPPGTAPGEDETKTITNAATGDSLVIQLIKGLPESVTGTSNGVGVNLGTFDWDDKGRLTKIGGTIGGKAVELSIGLDGRITNLKDPTSNQIFEYGGGQGFSLTISDDDRGMSHTVTADSVGDLTGISGTGTLSLGFETADTGFGRSTELKIGGQANPSVTMDFNHQGDLTGKSYTGLSEAYPRNRDGSLKELQTGSITADITETPTSRTTSYPDLTISEQYYQVGLRSAVSAPDDERSFIYERFALRKETHTGGVWEGWTVEMVPDSKGRLQKWKVNHGELNREFSFEYDNHSRLWKTISPQLTGTYGRNDSGQLESFTRGGISTSWNYDIKGLLDSVNNSVAGTHFNYIYSDRDSRHRILSRMVNGVGRSWTGLVYDNADQLKNANVGGRTLAYGYDTRGNRNAQGEMDSLVPNALNQIESRTLFSRGYGVYGTVHPLASLRVFHPQASNPALGTELQPDPESGEYYGWWPIGNGAGPAVDIVVRGTLGGSGGGGGAIAEQKLRVVVAPEHENFSYDGAGRIQADAYWIYSFDGAGRLTRMERKQGMSPEANVATEVVEFDYDADGRRTQKKRTITYLNSPRVKEEKSRVLWAGWLPVFEERSRNGALRDWRWFQWGADLSGKLGGAGGIGGLVAIHEEKANGQVRTLLPVQDGLGNVTAVVNASGGALVARYDYGPYGEPLGEYGEADACPFRWQTKWYDRESEHYYFGYRYYSPRLGCWLSRDPLGEEGGANLYSYCGNDPVNRHDPLGLEPITDLIRSRLAEELQAAINAADLLKYDAPNEGVRGTLKQNKVNEIMRNSKYYGFIVYEQGINLNGEAVQMRKIPGPDGSIVRRHVKGSKRPDFMILSDSDFKADVVRGGGLDLDGKIDAVISMKTGNEITTQDWKATVASRLKLSEAKILELKPKGDLPGAFRGVVQPTVMRAAIGADFLTLGGSVYFYGRDTAREMNNANPYVAVDQGGLPYSIGATYEAIKIFGLKSRFDRHAGWFLQYHAGPFADIPIDITKADYDRLNQKLKQQAQTLQDFLAD